jgi:hypothetical protein
VEITNFRSLFKLQIHYKLLSCIAGQFPWNRVIKLRSYICRPSGFLQKRKKLISVVKAGGHKTSR